jgi:hypothetical protein
MSYSPTVYRASTVTPRLLSRREAAEAGLAASWAATFISIATRMHGSGSKYSTSRGAE